MPSNHTNRMFASRIRDARRDAELTQQQLAARLGVPQQNVANWERGAVPRASQSGNEYRDLMHQLADFLDMRLPDLVMLCYMPDDLGAEDDPVASLRSEVAALTREVKRKLS